MATKTKAAPKVATNGSSTSGPQSVPEGKGPRCNVSKVKVGSVFSRHSFGVVTASDGYTYKLRNTDGFEWAISKDILAQEFSFADQHDTEAKVSRSEAIEILTKNSHTAMTVNFDKKLDPADVAAALQGGKGQLSDRDWQKAVAAALVGENRTMIGHHMGEFDEHQRLKFEEHGQGRRLVDPRTINFIVVNRVKYIVK